MVTNPELRRPEDPQCEAITKNGNRCTKKKLFDGTTWHKWCLAHAKSETRPKRV